MAHVNTVRTHDFGLLEGISSYFTALNASFAQYRAYRQTVAELSELSNRELADLGLSRSGIKRIALESVYGKNA
ncbi:MAG: DUF1127 domain-containing protein [Halocynthiibacter sp.]